MATAVMYVRGKGNESLEGYLEPFYGATYPTQTWTAVMERILDGEPVEEFPPPAYVDGDAPEEGHTYVPPPPPPTPHPEPTKKPTTSAPPTTERAADADRGAADHRPAPPTTEGTADDPAALDTAGARRRPTPARAVDAGDAAGRRRGVRLS